MKNSSPFSIAAHTEEGNIARVKSIARTGIWALVFCLVLTIAAYAPSLWNGFVNWDDPTYVTDQKLTESFDVLRNFHTLVAGNYHPLTMVLLAAEHKLFGNSAGWYHLVSLLLHVLCTALLFTIFLRLTGQLFVAAAMALLFGIHPMHVESVAWVSETKDVLYGVFYLSAWRAYVIGSQANLITVHRLVIVSILYLFSLLSKGQAVTLPAALLLADYLQNRHWHNKSGAEKSFFAVWFGLSIIFSALAWYAQKDIGAIRPDIVSHTLPERLLFTVYGIGLYLVKFVLPISQSAIYPYPVRDAVSGMFPASVYVSGMLAASLAVSIWFLRKKRNVLFGAGFFLLHLLPVVQKIVPVGSTIIADRYSYIAYIGLFYIAAVPVQKLWKRHRVLAGLFMAAGSIALFFFCFRAVRVWHDTVSLWSHTDKSDGTAWVYLGIYYQNVAGNSDSAQVCFSRALERNNFAEAHIGLSNIDLTRKPLSVAALQNAIANCKEVIRHRESPEAYANLGIAYGLGGKLDLAEKNLLQSIRLSPDLSPLTHYYLGQIYEKTKRCGAAAEEYSIAIRLGSTLVTPGHVDSLRTSQMQR